MMLIPEQSLLDPKEQQGKKQNRKHQESEREDWNVHAHDISKSIEYIECIML